MRPSESRLPRVFVSFAEADRRDSAVRLILESLSHEFTILTKEETIETEDSARAVARLIELSRAIVIILTHKESAWALFELGIAVSLGKRIFIAAPDRLDLSLMVTPRSARIIRYREGDLALIVDQLFNNLHKSATRKQRVLPKRRPERFELLVARVFESQGYNVLRSAKVVDPGADIIASVDLPGLDLAVKLAIECKFVFHPLGESHVEEAAESWFRKGYLPLLVTNSTFTRSALDSGERLGVLLIDGQELEKLAVKSQVGPETLGSIREELEILEKMKSGA